jgi:hypothetical protein
VDSPRPTDGGVLLPLLLQVVVTSQEQVASVQEGRRMKKHLVKLQQQAQGLAVMQPSVAQTQQDQRRLQVALQQVRPRRLLLHILLYSGTAWPAAAHQGLQQPSLLNGGFILHPHGPSTCACIAAWPAATPAAALACVLASPELCIRSCIYAPCPALPADG